jgi:uncharacterized protein (DUF2164 family)
MWVLNFLPNWAIHLIVLLGVGLIVASKFVGLIPAFNPLYGIIRSVIDRFGKILGIVVILFGVWLEGGNYFYNQTREEIKRIEQQSREATAKIQEEYQQKLAVTKQKGETIVKYVDKYITKEADAKCVIPNNVVVLHDSAAKNKVPDAARLTDENASGIALSTTAKTVTENYGTYHELVDQLTSLQRWIKEQQKIRE